MAVYLICTGLLGLLYLALTYNVSRVRRLKKISLGDGGDPEMLGAIRAHANFMEFVPLCLLLIYILLDLYGFRTIVCLSLGLLAARILHAAGLLGYLKSGRMLGAVGTMAVLLVCSVWTGLLGLGIRLY
jgi:uncharacterized protein